VFRFPLWLTDFENKKIIICKVGVLYKLMFVVFCIFECKNKQTEQNGNFVFKKSNFLTLSFVLG